MRFYLEVKSLSQVGEEKYAAFFFFFFAALSQILFSQ